MQAQRGFTLVEMTVSVAIVALMSSMAVLASVKFVTGSRISRVANQFADQASIARERAIARYEQWRIRFITPPGSAAIRSYVVESCQLPVGTPGSICPGPWVVQTTIQLENGTGLIVLNKDNATALIYDRTGQFLTASTDVIVCGTFTSGGGDTCRTSTNRVARIRSFSGIIETLTITQATSSVTVAPITGAIGVNVPLSAKLTPVVDGKTITFTVDGVEAGNGKTNVSGVATVNYTILKSIGKYSIGANFTADANSSAASGTNSLTVTQGTGSVSVTNVTGIYQSNVVLKANLSPALAGKKLSFSVDGALAGTGMTDAAGLATYTYAITNAGGNHIVTVAFAGDADLTAVSNTGTLTVTPATGVMTVAAVSGTYNSTVTLTATLSPIVAGKTVTFEVNGVSASSGTTDASGVATVNYLITNPLGIYSIQANFAGDTDITAASGSENLTVAEAPTTVTGADATGTYGLPVTLTATLTSGASPVAGKTVTFKVNGTAVGSGTTNASGVASVDYTVDLATGTYNIDFAFATDSYYLASADTKNLQVNK